MWLLAKSLPAGELSCPQSTYYASFVNTCLATGFTLLSLFFGIGIGKVLGRREANNLLRDLDNRNQQSTANNDKDATLGSTPNCDQTLIKQSTEAGQDDPGILLLPPAFETGYESTIEDAKEVLLSIIGLPGYEDGPYSAKPWALVRCGSASYLWASHATSDGILIRSSCFANVTAKSILKYIIDKDAVTGIEGIADRSEVIKTLHGGSITVRRICCKSGSFTSAKRDFTLITSNSVLSDGSYVVASRSIYVPESISALQRKSKNGFIRGIIYGSGYVLRPVRTAEGEGCEVFYAVHLDMLGSVKGSVNAAKTEELSSAVIDVMEKINQGCLLPPSRGLQAEPQSKYGDSSSGGTQTATATRYRAGSVTPTLRNNGTAPSPSPFGTSRQRAPSSAAFFSSNGSEMGFSVGSTLTTRGRIILNANQITALRATAASAKTLIRKLYKSFINHKAIRDASGPMLTRTTKSQNISSRNLLLSASDDSFQTFSESSDVIMGGMPNVLSSRHLLGRSGSVSGSANGSGGGISSKLAMSAVPRTAEENLQIAAAAAKVQQLDDQAAPVGPKRQQDTAAADGGNERERPSLQQSQRSVRSLSDSTSSLGNRPHTPTVVAGVAAAAAPAAAGVEIEKEHHKLWDTFFHQDGITISELQNGNAPVGILSAQCSIDAPPSKVRDILINQMESFDSLLTKRCILNDLDEKTHLQWLAYGSIWPVGARDFLVVTTEEPFDTSSSATGVSTSSGPAASAPAGDGSFVIVSTSVDDLCEEVDDIDNAIERIVGHDDGDVGYSRSCLRLAGYIGRPNTRGGVDLTLFLDVDAYAYTPAWLLQLLSQFGLCELMDRIRTVATEDTNRDGNNTSPLTISDVQSRSSTPTQTQTQTLPQMVSRIQMKDARMRVHTLEQDEDMKSIASEESRVPPPAVAAAKGSKQQPAQQQQQVGGVGVGGRPRFSTLKQSASDGTQDNRLITEQQRYAPIIGRPPNGVAEKNAPLPIIKETYFDEKSSSSSAVSKPVARRRSHLLSAEQVQAACQRVENKPPVAAAAAAVDKPGEFILRGKEIVRAGFVKLKIYLGLMRQPEGEPPLRLDWQMKISKKNMTVESTMVNESAWQAVRAVTFMKSTKETIMRLVTDDSRMALFDDMFDFAKPLVRVDERTAIRRLCFKGIWPTLPRDFLVCTSWTNLEDGSLLICSCSAPDLLFAPASGYVRGFIQISGYWIQPVETLAANDPVRIECGASSGCKVTLTAHTELGGTLPASVINMLSTSAPVKILTAVGDIVAKER